MTKLTNYFFVNSNDKEEIVVPKLLGGNFSGEFCLAGFTESGELLITDNIYKLSSHIITAKDDTKYEILDKHVDYADYENAMKESIPVIAKWEFDKIISNTHIIGICEGEEINKKIASQDGNFITLEDGTKYFINWSLMSDITKKRLEISYYHTYFKAVEEFCGIKCKIIL